MIDYSCPCPVKATLNIIGGKWKWLIYRELYFKGIRRFGEIEAGIPGISAKVLTEALKEMEADGLITRTVYAEVPARVEYELTEAGMSLEKVFMAMIDWGNHFLSKQYSFPD